MRHVTLTCKNHPDLRWICKSIAYTPGYGYNGIRNIFFTGWDTMPFKKECDCKGNSLVLAPEDEWHNLTIEQQKEALKSE